VETMTSIIGIDLGKRAFHVHGVDERGRKTVQKVLTRSQLRRFLGSQPPCTVAMEACGSAHHWSRYAAKLGHKVRMISPQYVKPFVKSNKNDRNDAEAICEAAERPSMRFVPTKSLDQQDLLTMHRIRQRRVRNRTSLINQIRGLLLEFGIPVPRGICRARRQLPEILEDATNELTTVGRALIAELRDELLLLERQIRAIESRIDAVFRQSERCQRLAAIPGIGPLTATALVASVGNGAEFRNGRHLAAWLGLVPRQFSTGGKNQLYGISKRGDRYVRTLLIHGARSAMLVMDRNRDPRRAWISALRARSCHNVAAVALANKVARVAWALLSSGNPYRPALAG
jgi:transposase